MGLSARCTFSIRIAAWGEGPVTRGPALRELRGALGVLRQGHYLLC